MKEFLYNWAHWGFTKTTIIYMVIAAICLFVINLITSIKMKSIVRIIISLIVIATIIVICVVMIKSNL